ICNMGEKESGLRILLRRYDCDTSTNHIRICETAGQWESAGAGDSHPTILKVCGESIIANFATNCTVRRDGPWGERLNRGSRFLHERDAHRALRTAQVRDAEHTSTIRGAYGSL